MEYDARADKVKDYYKNMSDSQEKFEFIKETRKERPINKRKLLIKLLFTVGSAIIFGIVAAVCYIIGTRSLTEVLYPEKIHTVTIIEEEPEVEIAEEVSIEAEDEEEKEKAVPSETVINKIVEKVDISVSDYEALYSNLHSIATEAAKSIVTVSGVDSDTDWFDDTYVNSERSAGLVIADNGKELLILVNGKTIEDSERIVVEFTNEETAEAELKKYDSNTNLSVVAVPLDSISRDAMDSIEMAKFGSTTVPNIEGRAVIAIGRPLGISHSIAYGFITSNSIIEHLVDTDVRVLTTDIYGSQNASGVLINLRGRVLGIISNDYAESDSANMINALSISDVGPVIESMSNGKDIAMLGIKGMDVSEKARTEQGIPEGAYVTEVQMGSPAMNAGIQSGDILVRIDGEAIPDFSVYKDVMSKKHPGDISRIIIKRFAQGEYKEVGFDITLETLE